MNAEVHRWAEVSDKKNMLIGSCGGLTGIYLARKFSAYPELCVLGADSNPDSSGRFFVNDVCILPSSADSTFISSLISLLDEREIAYYVPTHSSELRSVSLHEETIHEACPHTTFVVSPFKTFEALDDKLTMTHSLSAKGIPTPNQIDPMAVSHASYPLFAKRRFGSGGKDSMKVGSPTLMRALLEENPDIIGFEFLSGPEITVDCMFDTSGRLISFNQRRRIKTLGGAAIITQNDFDIDLEPYLRRFESSWIFKGCVNFQCIIQDGTPYFTDVNLRFPSGGMPLSVESGMNIPEMQLRLLRGQPCDPNHYESDRKRRTMYRYFDEIFEVKP